MLDSLTQLPSRFFGIAFLCLFFLFPQARVRAAETVDYLRNVKVILAARCYSCHGGLKQKDGLRLDTVQLIKKGGKNGPSIVPGNSEKSLLIDHVTARRDAARMPPETEGEPLKPAEIAYLKAWIDAGAPAPADEKPEVDPRDHWAFKVPVRPAVAGSGNPIDALISAEWDKRGLKPQPPAEPSLLLRRVSLDLIGLPPTQQELADFLADTSAGAYEKVVDRLLASPHYGERWGRHWMDIWRYSDWWGLGAEVRNSQKHIWHWRDWIIDSLNADKGYDQMVREMLAADELYPTDSNRLAATGFLARQYFRFNRNTWMEETVEHTSKAFLGLTMNCTKCHDHKFDPLTQQDFYRFRAFFEPYQVRTDMVGAQTDFEKDGIPRAFDCNLDAPTYLFIRGDERRPRKDLVISPGVPAILAFDTLAITPVQLPLEAYVPGVRPSIIQSVLKACETQERTAKKALEQAREAMNLVDGLDQKKPANAELAYALADKSLAAATLRTLVEKARIAADQARYQEPAATNAKDLARAAARLERQLAIALAEQSVAQAQFDLAQGPGTKQAPTAKKLAAARDALAKAKKDAQIQGETYSSLRGSLKTPESNLETPDSLNKPFPTTSTGRRSALAAWITDARNPLTARVAVNHIWARHFGQPLVATVFDFGRKGTPPTNPQLLDYLAVELQESGWSMKKLHRLIVTSNAYCMTSSSAGATGADLAVDPENRYLWRMNPVRMESEIVRDSLLYLSGELDLSMKGPSIPVADESTRRRSLYFVHSHNDQQKFLTTFDDASVLECYRRAESIVPQQALALENDKLVLSAAKKIAGRINEKDDAAFIKSAFSLILGSEPTANELGECQDALKELRDIAIGEKKPDAGLRARINLVHALLNHNDFVTIR